MTHLALFYNKQVVEKTAENNLKESPTWPPPLRQDISFNFSFIPLCVAIFVLY